MRKPIALLAVLITFNISAQENLQNYTPSILFDKGDWEFKSFQNVYTQTKSFNASGRKVDNPGGRQTWSTSINQFLYGANNQINVGFDVWIKSVSFQDKTFGSRTAIVGFGPKIKIAPIKALKRLSIQSTYLLPLADDLEGRPGTNDAFLHPDGSVWLNQIFYDLPLDDQFQLFFQQAFWHNFVRESFRENNYLQTQSSVFFSYFHTPVLTFYGMTEYFPTHYNDDSESGEAFFSYFVQSGAGIKYQLIPNFMELEFLYTNFWRGSESQGAGQTFNLGVRLIQQ